MTSPLEIGRLGIELLAREEGGWESGNEREELEEDVGAVVGAREGKQSCPAGGGGGGAEGEGDCLPSNLAVLLETNQALITFSVRFKLAAKALRSESIG